jgi:hypothetical protein
MPCSCNVNNIIKIVDCNACKIKRSANTNLQKNYYSSSELLKARCKTYTQGLTTNGYDPNNNSINKNCCDNSNNCGVYKRSNSQFNKQGAVSSSTRLLRLKYQSVSTNAKYNEFQPIYRGDTTMNKPIIPQNPVCFRRNGVKNLCNK